MGRLEIDNLNLGLTPHGDGQGLDLTVEDRTVCCLFSRDTESLRTVADTVTGMGDSYEGRIFIDGDPIDKFPPGKRGVAICGQNIGLYDHFTVTGNLAIPFKNIGIPNAELKPRIEKRLWDFELYESAMEYPEELSPSKRLLLSFAKSATAHPRLLVCDLIYPNPSGFEGYANLSLLKRQAEIMELTVLALTDNNFYALNFADEIAHLSNGKILQQAPPKDVLNSPEHIEVAKDFAFPALNIFEGTITEETPFIFVEEDGVFFNLPERLKDYFRSKLGMRQYMAVRPEKVQLVNPNEMRAGGKNIVSISRIDYLGLGVFAYFSLGPKEWCAFLSPDKMIYTGMQFGIFVPEDAWFFIDDDGYLQLDL